MKKFLTCTLLLILSFQFVFNNTYTAYASINSNNSATTNSGTEVALAASSSTTTTTSTDDIPKTLESLQKYLKSEGIALVDANTGRVLYQQNGDTLMYPASTTKIMTALLTIENVSLDDVVTVGEEATSVPADSSLMTPRLVVGEQLTVRDLLYAMMFKSSNDAAETLALYVGGTREHFIEMMNEKAKELGMDNTHYANPHGYQDENHYTTPLDMARLAIYATKDATFMSIVSSTTYTIPKTNKCKARVITNVNRLLNSSATEYLASATGMKTGTTNDAQECLVSSASSDGYSVVCVTLKHPIDSTPNRFVEGKKLLQYGLYLLENTPADSTEALTAQYVYPTPTPTPTLILNLIDSTASISVEGFFAKINDLYSSLGMIVQIIITIIIVFLVLLLLLVILRKRKARRRKYRRKYIASRAGKNYKIDIPSKPKRRR